MTLDDIENLDVAQCPCFATLAPDQLPMPGVKKRLESILNQKILVVDFRIRNSKRRVGTDCLQLQFVLDRTVCVLFTGSSVLIDQIQNAWEKHSGPFYTTIIKIDKYYSFS